MSDITDNFLKILSSFTSYKAALKVVFAALGCLASNYFLIDYEIFLVLTENTRVFVVNMIGFGAGTLIYYLLLVFVQYVYKFFSNLYKARKDKQHNYELQKDKIRKTASLIDNIRTGYKHYSDYQRDLLQALAHESQSANIYLSEVKVLLEQGIIQKVLQLDGTYWVVSVAPEFKEIISVVTDVEFQKLLNNFKQQYPKDYFTLIKLLQKGPLPTSIDFDLIKHLREDEGFIRGNFGHGLDGQHEVALWFENGIQCKLEVLYGIELVSELRCNVNCSGGREVPA